MKEVKVKLNETQAPSAEVVAKQNETVVVIDSTGRSIKLKKPSVLAQYRLIESLGDTAKNEVYTGMVLPLIYVIEVDDVAVYQPKTKGEIEALINLLDEAGVQAVSEGVISNFGKTDPEADKKNLKN